GGARRGGRKKLWCPTRQAQEESAPHSSPPPPQMARPLAFRGWRRTRGERPESNRPRGFEALRLHHLGLSVGWRRRCSPNQRRPARANWKGYTDAFPPSDPEVDGSAAPRARKLARPLRQRRAVGPCLRWRQTARN